VLAYFGFQAILPYLICLLLSMTSIECVHGTRHYPFGHFHADSSTADSSSNRWNMENVVSLPISPSTNEAIEDGDPITLLRPSSATEELESFRSLATMVSKELFKLEFNETQASEFLVAFDHNEKSTVFNISTLQLTIDKIVGSNLVATFTARFFSETDAIQKQIQAKDLRHRDPKSGAKLEGFDNSTTNVEKVPSGKVSPKSIPTKVTRKGRYGYAVLWNDGSTIIYSLQCLAIAAGGRELR
jgi:hypothetical protein